LFDVLRGDKFSQIFLLLFFQAEKLIGDSEIANNFRGNRKPQELISFDAIFKERFYP
jgi:hypothetical protein